MYFEHDNDDMESFWTIPAKSDFFSMTYQKPCYYHKWKKGWKHWQWNYFIYVSLKHRATCINVD